jgi:hypothetical protein
MPTGRPRLDASRTPMTATRRVENSLMNATVCRGLIRSITASALAAGFCAAFATHAEAACPTPRQLKVPGVSWSDHGSGDQAYVVRAAAFESPERESSIVGLWKVDLIMDGQVIDQGFDAWHGDGTETLNDSVSPLLGNVCLGVWEKTGRRTYTLKHPSWSYDNNGTLVGTVVIHELVTLDRGGNSYRGTVLFEVFDLDENKVFEGAGEVIGKRITAR